MNNKLTLNIAERYSRKLYQFHFVEDLVEKLRQERILDNRTNIELNITSCRLAYPATPQFIDYFLDHLSQQEGEKNLTIKMGCVSYFEWVCLNIIVLEGTFFEVKIKMNTNEDLMQNRAIINSKLKANKITLNIVLDNISNIEYKYGYDE
jgi:hypothetical protein